MEYKCIAAAFPELSAAALFQLASTPHGTALFLVSASLHPTKVLGAAFGPSLPDHWTLASLCQYCTDLSMTSNSYRSCALMGCANLIAHTLLVKVQELQADLGFKSNPKLPGGYITWGLQARKSECMRAPDLMSWVQTGPHSLSPFCRQTPPVSCPTTQRFPTQKEPPFCTCWRLTGSLSAKTPSG